MTFFRKAWIIARKDVLAELRSREMLSTMGAFAALIILLGAAYNAEALARRSVDSPSSRT